MAKYDFAELIALTLIYKRHNLKLYKMKYFFTLIHLFISLFLVMGQERILPEFKEAEPLWVNKIINKNYPYSPSSSADSCDSHSYIDMLEAGDFVYSLFYTFDPEANRPPNGYILNKTNKQTGEIVWSDVNTPINGAPGSLFAYDIRLRSDNNIEIVADRKVDFNDGSSFRYYPLSYRRVYDQFNGEILSTNYDKANVASLGNNGTFKYAHYHCVKEDSIYLAYYNDIVVKNDSAFQNLKFGMLNGTMDYAEDTVASIFDRDVRLGLGFHQNFSNHSMNLNDSTVVWLSASISNDLSVNTNKVRLFFIDVKDPKNIFIRRKVILDDKLFIQKLPRTTTYLYVRNNDVFIMNSNLLLNPQTIEHNIIHMDANGNEIGIYEKLNNKGIPYIYILPVKATDSLAYFIGTKPNKTQNDLFTIDRLGHVKVLTTLTTKNDEPENYFQILENSCLLTNEDVFIYGGAYNERNPVKNTILMHGFDLHSLINGYTRVEDVLIENNEMLEIFPNPANNYVIIKGLKSAVTAFIFDLNGSIVKKIENAKEQIEISELNSGVYFLQILTGENRKTYKVFKL